MKDISHVDFSLELSRFLRYMTNVSKKWQCKFCSIFGPESVQNDPKGVSKQLYQFQKNFTLLNFFKDLNFFLKKVKYKIVLLQRIIVLRSVSIRARFEGGHIGLASGHGKKFDVINL